MLVSTDHEYAQQHTYEWIIKWRFKANSNNIVKVTLHMSVCHQAHIHMLQLTLCAYTARPLSVLKNIFALFTLSKLILFFSVSPIRF